jgi:hypothetical protein
MSSASLKSTSTTKTHPGFKFYGGDDWQIEVTLTDDDGAPLVLDVADILWTMNDSKGGLVFADGDFTISLLDAAGGVYAITVPAAKTTEIAGATYSDALRIVENNIASTLSVGAIYVTSDPFAAPVAVAAAEPVEPQRARLRLAKG